MNGNQSTSGGGKRVSVLTVNRNTLGEVMSGSLNATSYSFGSMLVRRPRSLVDVFPIIADHLDDSDAVKDFVTASLRDENLVAILKDRNITRTVLTNVFSLQPRQRVSTPNYDARQLQAALVAVLNKSSHEAPSSLSQLFYVTVICELLDVFNNRASTEQISYTVERGDRAHITKRALLDQAIENLVLDEVVQVIKRGKQNVLKACPDGKLPKGPFSIANLSGVIAAELSSIADVFFKAQLKLNEFKDVLTLVAAFILRDDEVLSQYPSLLTNEQIMALSRNASVVRVSLEHYEPGAVIALADYAVADAAAVVSSLLYNLRDYEVVSSENHVLNYHYEGANSRLAPNSVIIDLKQEAASETTLCYVVRESDHDLCDVRRLSAGESAQLPKAGADLLSSATTLAINVMGQQHVEQHAIKWDDGVAALKLGFLNMSKPLMLDLALLMHNTEIAYVSDPNGIEEDTILNQDGTEIASENSTLIASIRHSNARIKKLSGNVEFRFSVSDHQGLCEGLLTPAASNLFLTANPFVACGVSLGQKRTSTTDKVYVSADVLGGKDKFYGLWTIKGHSIDELEYQRIPHPFHEDITVSTRIMAALPAFRNHLQIYKGDTWQSVFDKLLLSYTTTAESAALISLEEENENRADVCWSVWVLNVSELIASWYSKEVAAKYLLTRVLADLHKAEVEARRYSAVPPFSSTSLKGAIAVRLFFSVLKSMSKSQANEEDYSNMVVAADVATAWQHVGLRV